MKKNYRVIDGGTTYLIISPRDARRILMGIGGMEASSLSVYAIYPDGHTERLQADVDVSIFQNEGVSEFGLRVGELSNMLLNIEP